MRLFDLKENDRQLEDLLPAMGASTGAPAPGATQVGQPLGQQPGQPAAGLAGGQMDPAQAAQAKKDHDQQKKQVQDAIKQKQQELADLQKQLAQLG